MTIISDAQAKAAHEVHRQYLVPVSLLAPMIGVSYQALQKAWDSRGLKDLGFGVSKRAMSPVSPNEAKAYRNLYQMGFGTHSISKIFKRSPVTIHQHLAAQGIEMEAKKGNSIVIRLPFGGGDRKGSLTSRKAKENKMSKKKFIVSYADFQVKDFGADVEAAKSFVKENGGVVFEITPQKATGIADSQGDMHHTYTARNK